MSRDRIIEAATRMVVTGGVDALSMRKLAAELGVAPTAIYWHVGGREQLLGAVFEEMLATMPPILVRGDTPLERIAGIARSIRQQVRDAPVVQQLAQHLGRTPEGVFPGHLALAREVTATGLAGDDAADAVRSILFLIGGFVLLEGTFRRRPPGARTSQELWQAIAEPDIEPELTASMTKPADPDALFEYAVDRLVRSILPA
ncbi:MAG TPA: helix-turn-helix domain-containing protein [Acidimicrobiales bacterium]|jgi:AcrR family transcriptional regulator|nr:helix-turn-helix domain-containing protein [Acidimicrobiales bacterium]